MNGRDWVRRSLALAMVLGGLLLVASGEPSQATEPLLVDPTESRGTSEAEAPVVTGLVPNRLPLVPGATGTVTVTMNAAQRTDTAIALRSSDPTVAFVPATISVPAGALAVAVPVAAGSPGAATLTASLNGTLAQTRVTVTNAPPALVSLLPPVLPLTAGSTGTLTVTLSASQSTDTIVFLATSDPVIVGLPGDRVTVPAGQLAVSVPVAGVSFGTATVTASLHGTTSTAAITVQPPPPTLTGLACPGMLTGGATILCAVTLNAGQASDTIVPLSVSDTDVVAVAPTVTVPAHTRTATVAVTGTGPGVATLTAGPLHETIQTTTVQVLPPPPTVVRLLPSPASLNVGTTNTLTLALNAAQVTETSVALGSTPPGIVETPASVTVPAGSLTAAVPLTALAAGQATVSAGPLHGSQAQITVTVTPASATVTGLSPATLELPQGSAEPLTVRIAPVQPDAISVPLTSSDPTIAEVPPSVPVPAGETSASFPVIGRATGEATVSAGPFGGDSRQATVTVQPPDLLALVVAPVAPTVPPGQSQAFTAAGTFTDGSTQDVTAVVAWTSSHPSVAMISPGGVATALTVGTALITATPPAGPTASATLTVLPVSSIGKGAATPSSSVRDSGPGLGSPLSGATATPTQAPVLPGGRRALAGRILTTEGQPLAGVTLRLLTTGGQSFAAVTDGGGNFLLQDPPPGEQLLLVDGETASAPGAKYPTIPVTVTILPDGVTPLHYTPHLHAQKERNFTPIHPTRGAVATDPELPGVALRIPAGAKIIGWDGQPNTKVSIRTVPIDRLPVPPLPAGVRARTVYMFYFGKRGGGIASQPIPFDAPNDLGLAPGAKADLWFFDESPLPGVGPNAWRKAGTGTVTADGRLIRSDPGVGIPRFCCGSTLYGDPRTDTPKVPGDTPPLGGETLGGEPVDLSTGIFMLTATDLVLPGRIPVALTRTYRSGESLAGPFGIGTTLNYDDYLQATSSTVFTYVYRGDATTQFLQQPDGTFTNTTVPAFRGAKIIVNPDTTRTLRFKDGAALVFANYGVLIRVEDRRGNQVVIERLMETNPTAIHEPSGRALTLTWVSLARDHVTSAQDPLGRTVQYSYDGQNRLVAVTNPAGGVTQYAYDAQHRMTSITDARGITFLQNSYDVNSRVCQQTQADGSKFTFYYITADRATLPESQQLLSEAAAGGPISQAPCSGVASNAIVTATVLVDPRGKPTTYRFNGQGYLTQVTDALGQVTTYEREAGTNLLLSVTDPLNRVTRFQYDANGNPTQITDPGNNVRTFTYEPTFSQVTSAVDPLGNTTTFEYDAQGNLTALTDPVQNQQPVGQRQKTQLAYNQYGQPMTTTDPLGNTTTFIYNTQGDLTTITDPLGHTTTRTYDGVSRLLTQSDPLGRTTHFGYDALNRLALLVDPLGAQTGFAYDPNGNLLTVTDPWGNTTAHEYDAMDRLSRRIDPLGKSEIFSYDGNGNLTSTTDRKSQTTTFTYDPLNRRTEASYADGSVATFTYDAGSRLTQINDTADPHRPITRTYDPIDRVLTETTALGTVTYTYDAAGRRTSMTVSGQAPVSYTYDHNARLRTITQAPLNPVSIDYDAANRRTLLTLPNGVSTQYVYDLGSRLTALVYRNALGQLGDLQYSYDGNGNRTSVGGTFARTLLPDAVPSATYDAANRQLAFGAQTMAFDDNGNQASLTTGGQTTTYSWDARNRLTGLSGPAVAASFAYDGFGRRALKIISGQDTSFQYDALDIVQETGGTGPVSYLRTLAIDEAFVRTDSTGTAYYIGDALGTTIALTDATGATPTSYTYAPFGQSSVSGLPSSNPFQFTGRENDGTGLYHYRARYHHPGLARFLGEDAIPKANLYVYSANNPVRFIDPLGLAKGGRQRIAGDDPITRGLGPKSDPNDIKNAIEAIKKGVQNGEITGKRKAFLEGWAKVAKRGFKYGGIIWFLLEELFIDVAEAGETPEELEAFTRCQELNAKEKEPCARSVPFE